MLSLKLLDWCGLTLWLIAWVAYPLLSKVWARNQASLVGHTLIYRRLWMQNALAREQRVADAALIGNLMQTSTFFFSTTVLTLGALLASLGSIDQSLRVVISLPLAEQQSAVGAEIKMLVMMLVFVHALMRFTWALRQFNLVSILVGAMPSHPERMTDAAALSNADKAARLSELAGDNFSQGIRSYYYAVPVLLWFLNAWLLIVATLLISLVVFYMDFRSQTVRALAYTRDPS